MAIIGSHFESIAAGNLARPNAVYGRNEITAIFASLKTMQQALRGTVSDVRKGRPGCTLGSRRLSQAITISSSYRTAGRHRWHKRPPVRSINHHGTAKRR
ncbi:HAMP domain-containing protein [Shigella flexneri]